jgi:hypothetical protein
MKVFTYHVYQPGDGRCDIYDGIVIANTESEARGSVLNKYPKSYSSGIEIEEINTDEIFAYELSHDGWEE